MYGKFLWTFVYFKGTIRRDKVSGVHGKFNPIGIIKGIVLFVCDANTQKSNLASESLCKMETFSEIGPAFTKCPMENV